MHQKCKFNTLPLFRIFTGNPRQDRLQSAPAGDQRGDGHGDHGPPLQEDRGHQEGVPEEEV